MQASQQSPLSVDVPCRLCPLPDYMEARQHSGRAHGEKTTYSESGWYAGAQVPVTGGDGACWNFCGLGIGRLLGCTITPTTGRGYPALSELGGSRSAIRWDVVRLTIALPPESDGTALSYAETGGLAPERVKPVEGKPSAA